MHAVLNGWLSLFFLKLPEGGSVHLSSATQDESPTPYFLLRLLTDLSLVPDSEVMLGGERRGVRTGQERTGEERKKTLCSCFTFKKKKRKKRERPPDRFQLTTTPLQFSLLSLEATSSKRMWKPLTSPFHRQERDPPSSPPEDRGRKRRKKKELNKS